MAELKSIVTEMASRIPDVSVKVSRVRETVLIRDDKGEFEDIFMQGQDAAQFIAELDDLIEKAPEDLAFEDAIKCLAAPYCENIWN